MTGRELVQQALGLTLIVLLLAGCGGVPAEPTATPVPSTATPTPVPPTPSPSPSPSPIPRMGIITGMVLDKDGNPLVNIYDQETLIVALVCLSDDSDIECLHRGPWENYLTALFDSICEADDTASNCLLHLGLGAVSVATDGSYTIADVPLGKYRLVFLFMDSRRRRASYPLGLELTTAGEIIQYDIQTRVPRP